MKFWNQYKGKIAVVAMFTTVVYYTLAKANWEYAEDMFRENQYYIKKYEEKEQTR